MLIAPYFFVVLMPIVMSQNFGSDPRVPPLNPGQSNWFINNPIQEPNRLIHNQFSQRNWQNNNPIVTQYGIGQPPMNAWANNNPSSYPRGMSTSPTTSRTTSQITSQRTPQKQKSYGEFLNDEPAEMRWEETNQYIAYTCKYCPSKLGSSVA